MMSEMSREELEALVAQYKGQVTKLEARAAAPLKFKVTEKGGISIYGLQKFPVTLYKNQWEKIFAAADQMKDFMTENESRLSVK